MRETSVQLLPIKIHCHQLQKLLVRRNEKIEGKEMLPLT